MVEVGTKVVIKNYPKRNLYTDWNGWEGTVVDNDCDCHNCMNHISVVFEKTVSYPLEIFSPGCIFLFNKDNLELT